MSDAEIAAWAGGILAVVTAIVAAIRRIRAARAERERIRDEARADRAVKRGFGA